MKSNRINHSFLLVLSLFLSGVMYAQCPFTNTYFGTGVAPSPGNSATLNTCSFIGEAVTATGVVAGDNYTVDITYSSGQPNGVVPFVVVYNDAFAAVAWGDSTVTFTAPVSGTYYSIPFFDSTCTTFDPDFGCNATLWTNNGQMVSTAETSIAQLALYPNPTSDLVSIRFEGETVELNIVDSQGKTVYANSIKNGAEIDLSPFEKGIYFFSLRTTEYAETHRVVLQ